MPAHYDDPTYSYTNYWQNRDYEHQSEVIAIKKILNHRHFDNGIDLGGGFGRLTPILANYCTKITLVEPSAKLRSQAKRYLNHLNRVAITHGTAQSTGLASTSQDLVFTVRVFHHIPDLHPALAEINRVLKPSGYVLLEFANSLNIKARIRSLFSGSPILLAPIERRSAANIRKHTIAFVNHHPHTIHKLLRQHGFTPVQTLSVSNFRMGVLKKIIPIKLLLVLEQISQPLLAYAYFGPSIFILAQKKSQTSPQV